MKIKHLVQKAYQTVQPYAGVEGAKERLAASSFLVVMDNDFYLGILTLADIVEAPHSLVIDCLHAPPHLDPEQDIESALNLMKETRNRVLPVFKEGALLGVVTQSAILDYLLEYRLRFEQATLEPAAEPEAANQHLPQEIKGRKRAGKEPGKNQRIEAPGPPATRIAHDCQHLLTGILDNISLAKMGQAVTPEVLEILNESERAAFQAKKLADQLLTFSRQAAPVKKTISVAKLLQDITDSAQEGSSLQFQSSIHPDLWPVTVDEGQVRQVMENLVTNARRAMPEGGTIQVQAQNTVVEPSNCLPLKEGRYVRIAVKGPGPATPGKKLPQIFDLYFSAPESGGGPDLAVSYSIIQKQEETPDLKPEPRLATTLYLYLPASEGPAIENDGEGPDEPLAEARKILVMDDTEVVREVVGQMIRHMGYEVELAREGEEAIELYKKAQASGQPFDAVILDLTIPGGMGGKETIKKLLEIDPAAKGILSSGYCNAPVMAEFTKYGFCGVIPKPYGVGQLNRTLRQVMANQR